jgi:hypothetical protein
MMGAGTDQLTYGASVGMSWVVQAHGVRVSDELARRSETLDYPEAAIWELLLRGHSVREAGAALQWILEVPADQAQGLVARCVREWTGAGWLETKGGEGR